MASNNIARLGVVLGLDTAEFTASIDKAIAANKSLKREIKSDSNAAAKEITALKFATDDYGKTLSKVELVGREVASGRYKNAIIELKTKLLDQAAAYDAVAASAQKAAQNTQISSDIQKINFATQDYGKTLTQVQSIEREIASGKYRTATEEQRHALLKSAAAYDAIAVAAEKASQSKKVTDDIKQLAFATQDYGKTLTKVELIEREIASGKYRTATQQEIASIRNQAAAYDAVAISAKKAAQAEQIAADIKSITHATEDYGKTLSRVQVMEREIATGKYRTASPEQRQSLLNAAAAYDAVSGSVKKVNAGLTEQQKLGISYQITDFVTQIGSGQSAMVALLQQGGQLKDQLGGFGNAFRLLKEAISPVAVALTAVTATVGILGFAFYKGSQESDALRDSLILTGRYAGVTQAGFQQLSDSLSNSLNYSIGNTKDILSALISSGKFTSDSLGSVAQSIALVAKLSGESVTAVTQKLIPAFNGTASSAKSMNDQYHFLTLAQYKQIEALEKQGRAQEAIKVQADAFNASIKDQVRNLGFIEQAWTDIGNAISRAWDYIKSIGRTNDPAQQLVLVMKELNVQQQRLQGFEENAIRSEGRKKAIQDAIDRLTLEKTKLTEQIVGEQKKEDESKKETKKINIYADANGLSAQRKIEDEINKLAYANQIALKKQEATEIQAIELDSQRKIQEARNEMLQANRDQKNAFPELQIKLFAQKELAIATETAQKISGIRTKINQEAAQADLAYLEEVAAFMSARQTAFDSAMMSQIKSIELESLSLEFAKQRADAENSLLFATEKELKLLRLRLDTEEKIAKVKLDRTLDDTGKQAVIDQIKQQQSIKEALIETEDRYKRIGEMWDSVTNNMTQALDNFTKTGKLNFKDFARSVIQDLIAIQLKAQATSLLRMAVGAVTSAFSGGFTNDMGGKELAGSLGFADGGEPPVNQASWVGERGPELFVPKTAGTIVPNHALSGMASTTNVTNNYISAIDVKSFEDRIYGSAKAVWAANAYAAKGLATSSGRA